MSDEFWEDTAAPAGLRAAAADLRGIEAPARVEARLIAAFRRENGISAPGGTRQRWIPALTWLSAAAAVLALALLLVRGRDPGHRGTPAAPSRSAQNALQWAGAQLPAVVLGEATADAGGEFVALPNAADIGPNDDVNIVRLEVPRERLLALGFVIDADHASDTVEADVVLGADGLARAVRFVE
jgi:hypothetical protein